MCEREGVGERGLGREIGEIGETRVREIENSLGVGRESKIFEDKKVSEAVPM